MRQNMLLNYFKVTIRNLYRHRGYAFINIFGLSIGLAACLVILAYVQFERSYDRFHTKADRIYRLEMNVPTGNETNVWTSALTPLGSVLKESFPEIEAVTQVRRNPEALVRSGDARFYESYFRYADAALFDVFDFEIVRGSSASLTEPGTVFLSRSTARRYFGDEDPLGKTLEVSDKYDQNTEIFEVVGIIEDTPPNSHVHFDFLASMATSMTGVTDAWRTLSYTYFLLDGEHQIHDLI
jgi:putative ABC transport system permease protein